MRGVVDMAESQRNIKPALKLQLINEAGGKCANPGCSNWRSHIHHIKHWAVYKVHDTNEMIAVCPACHDSIHYGRLEICDETLYRWKRIFRTTTPGASHIYVEPAPNQELKLLMGTIALSTVNDRQIVFDHSNGNHLELRMLDGDILQVSSRLNDQSGNEVLRVIENHVKAKRDPHISFDSRAGHVRITVPATEKFIPAWVIERMRVQEPSYALDDRIVALDLEVERPGVIRVEGFWMTNASAIVITKERFALCDVSRQSPISFIGEGEQSVLKFVGPATRPMFGMQ